MRAVYSMAIFICLVLSAGLSQALVINEILYDGSVDGDPNQDGSLDASEDEFIELVNETGADLDISGWTLADADMVRHIFPPGTIIPANCCIIIFGGGTPTGSFGDALVQVASEGPLPGLSLNNSGDTVVVSDGAVTVASYSYLGVVADESLTRYPDVSGTDPLVPHTSVSTLEYSPGTDVNGVPFPGCAPPTWYRDADNDGWGDELDTLVSETQPAGYVSQPGDCDDSDDEVYPGASEICGDGVDNNCSGGADEGCPTLIINEINYDPGTVDANEDGSVDATHDEFIELVNVSGFDIDLTEYIVTVGGDDRFVFSMGPIIPSTGAVVVFGGGFVSNFTACPAVVAAGLSLNNTGDVVEIFDPTRTLMATYTYPGTVADVSITRYPDVTGSEPFVPHDTVSAAECSPGTRVDGSSFIILQNLTWYRDLDEDGWGDENDTLFLPTQPAGYVSQPGDCDDNDDTVYPGAPELADGIDNDCDGSIDEGVTVYAIVDVGDVGNDQGRLVRVRWGRHADDAVGSQDPVLSYSLYRRIDGNKNIDTSDWDFVLNLPAATQTAYNALAPTLCDSTDRGICWSVFAVRAHTGSPGVFHDSEPDSGYSVDNLAPGVPENLQLTDTTLSWDEAAEPDFDFFTLYGSHQPAWDESAALIDFTTGTTYDVTGQTFEYFHLTATDFNGNEGAAASAMAVSGVPGTVPTGWALHSSVPNPFNPTTRISFAVPEAHKVSLLIYDISGRLVRTLVAKEMLAARIHVREWNGLDNAGQSVAAGVYFYRLEAGDFSATKRTTLVK